MQSPCGSREHSILEEIYRSQMGREETRGCKAGASVAAAVVVAGEVCSGHTLHANVKKSRAIGSH